MRIRCTTVFEWPPLAWLARCRPGHDAVEVRHGPGVEVAEDWLCEAVWDGDFPAGGFDLTDVVAGSGVRLRDGRVVFVSSGTTVDRLQWILHGGELLVSNSLVCLMATVGGSFRPSYAHHHRDFASIKRGIFDYVDTLATTAGPVHLTYFHNLAWNGTELSIEGKPGGDRSFPDFESYEAFLDGSLRAVAANMSDAGRQRPFQMLGTLSSGYDSATVTTLAARTGCVKAISFDRAEGGEDDSGEPVADALGIELLRVPRDAWERHELAEIPFMAADAYGEEVHFRAVEDELEGKVLLTGTPGGRFWHKHTPAAGPDLARDDLSGLALTEYRLSASFINCAVPFWGGRQVDDIVAISRSPGMRDWDMPDRYSKPICRRIVEGAGVPRDAFGRTKLAASVLLQRRRDFLTPASRERYLRWLRDHRGSWLRQGRLPPLPSAALDRALVSGLDVPKALYVRLDSPRRRRAIPLGDHAWSELGRRAEELRFRPTYLRRYAFPWAVEEAKAAYAG